jgi:hypothetical protein
LAAAVVAEHAERGGNLHTRDHLTVAQRRAMEELEIASGSPRGTIMLGGLRVSLDNPP